MSVRIAACPNVMYFLTRAVRKILIFRKRVFDFDVLCMFRFILGVGLILKI